MKLFSVGIEFNNVIEALVEGHVTDEEFNSFAVAFDVQDDPFISNILRNLSKQNVMSVPSVPIEWTEEDADRLLEALKFPEPESSDFEPWSPCSKSAALEAEYIISACIAWLKVRIKMCRLFVMICDWDPTKDSKNNHPAHKTKFQVH